jgi:hypothetical protein
MPSRLILGKEEALSFAQENSKRSEAGKGKPG